MEISPQQWDRVKELFEAALECSPAQRASFLLQHERDEVVRKEVVRLLAEHDDLHGFLSTSPYFDARVPATESERRIEAGRVLAGRFQIVNFVAAGGLGEVYKAEDLLLGRTVALKFLFKEQSADHPSLERLRSEAKVASSLNHPNICTVYDFGEDAGRAFIAMEFLEGETLCARLRKGPLPVEETLKIAIPIARALDAAHHKGMIHRDLKPGNILLAETGVKLLDFGLARKANQNAREAETASVITNAERVVGTLPYMSPEQLRCEELDAHADIFAFGAVLYEMLTGANAFQRRSSSETVSAVLHEEPRPLKDFAKHVPRDLEGIVRRCLRKQSSERYASMQDVEQDLKGCLARTATSEVTLGLLLRQGKKPAVAIPLLLGLVLSAGLSGWWLHHNSRTRWARYQALPQIARLIEAERVSEAYGLAVQAERYIPNDPVLLKSWDQISYITSIHTTPPGASVYRKNYGAGDWEFVGFSPLEKRRFPSVDSRWKFEMKGFVTVERAAFTDYLSDSMSIIMTEEGKAPSGMVHVTIQGPGSTESVPVSLYFVPGFTDLPPVPLENYWIDKYEVTNRQFKAFLDAGGYENPAYWDQEFRRDARLLPWRKAMAFFRDATGRPGPATWAQGEYPSGQDDFPVSGVSWYEAAAYAKSVGKSLPTIYHWKVAATRLASASIIPASNFSGRGPSRVGGYQGVSEFGAYDMAGNVKEWILNQNSSGNRYVLGGAWNEPSYVFLNVDARSPFDRSTNIGFRCAKYSLSAEYAKAAGVIDPKLRDYAKEKPVADDVFRVIKNLYAYDKTPLNSRVESVQQAENWSRQKITYDAAYGKERIIAYLYLPRKTSPPFQAVIYFPGANAVEVPSSDNQPELEVFDFVIRSGRAVLFPVYKGTYERADGFRFGSKNTSNFRDHMIAWAKDFRRSIDYLETRPDINVRRLGYLGWSWGAAMGAILPALDSRPKALVLICPGFYMQEIFPEADPFNFAPRVTAPVLMLNGRYDFVFPPNSSQEPMFRLLGTPNENKRRVVYDTAHDIPTNEFVKESLDWLDRYLGPVK